MEIHCKITNTPVENSVMPVTETIQWISGVAVQPKRKRPIGGKTAASRAGLRRCSCGGGVVRARRRGLR